MTPPELAEAFGEFDVDAVPLGSGNFKVAHRVLIDGRSFVLKVVKQPVDDADAALPERLRREMEAMSSVDSPRVVRIAEGPTVRDIGGEQHVWYLEPYYEGGTLAARPAQVGLEEVLSLTGGLLEGVEALWTQARLVHRDIKPANIAFDADGLPVLLDLGIAFHHDLTPLTEPFGMSPRTPAYAAPEQFELRRIADIDFRTDLFLVGVVSFERLTGHHPFAPQSDPANYLIRLAGGIVDQGALDAVDNAEAFKMFLQRLLRPRPNQRFRTLASMRRAFEVAGT